MQFRKLIEKRRSVKKFLLSTRCDWRNIIRAIDTARFIPVAGNLYNLKFVVVSEKEIISQIANACQQPFVGGANYVVVCVSDPSVLTRVYGERGERYTAQQAGAAIENFLLALTDQGLASTWVGHFYEDMIKALLFIPEDLVVEGVFPVGLEAKNASTKEKFKADLDNLVYFDKWGNKFMEPETRVHNSRL